MPHPFYLRKETKIIIMKYPKRPKVFRKEKFNPIIHREDPEIVRARKAKGPKKRRSWTDPEIEIVLANIHLTHREVQKLLTASGYPVRNLSTISSYMSLHRKSLGVTASRKKVAV